MVPAIQHMALLGSVAAAAASGATATSVSNAPTNTAQQTFIAPGTGAGLIINLYQPVYDASVPRPNTYRVNIPNQQQLEYFNLFVNSLKSPVKAADFIKTYTEMLELAKEAIALTDTPQNGSTITINDNPANFVARISAALAKWTPTAAWPKQTTYYKSQTQAGRTPSDAQNLVKNRIETTLNFFKPGYEGRYFNAFAFAPTGINLSREILRLQGPITGEDNNSHRDVNNNEGVIDTPTNNNPDNETPGTVDEDANNLLNKAAPYLFLAGLVGFGLYLASRLKKVEKIYHEN